MKAMKTSNIERRTLNAEGPRGQIKTMEALLQRITSGRCAVKQSEPPYVGCYNLIE
jgi:hypothetical protein